MNDITKSWIKAAKLLAEKPDAIVSCPSCKVGRLKVKDELIIDWNKVDRYLYCDTCGNWNVLTMSGPKPMTSYERKVRSSILRQSEFKINEVTDIEYIITLRHYHQYLSEVIDLLKTGKYEQLKRMKDDSESFDDLTVLKFRENNSAAYYAIIYDDWALETDPIVTHLFPAVE